MSDPPLVFQWLSSEYSSEVFCNLFPSLSWWTPIPLFSACFADFSFPSSEVSICDKSHPIEGYLGAILAPTFSRIIRFDNLIRIFIDFFYRGMDSYWFFSVYRGLLLGWGHVRYPRKCVWYFLRSVQTLEPTLQIPTFQKSILGGGQALVIVLGSVTRHFSIFLIPTPSLVDISAPHLGLWESSCSFFFGPKMMGTDLKCKAPWSLKIRP